MDTCPRMEANYYYMMTAVEDWWTSLVDQPGGLAWWTRPVDWTGGLEWWIGLDWQTGLVQWTAGLTLKPFYTF